MRGTGGAGGTRLASAGPVRASAVTPPTRPCRASIRNSAALNPSSDTAVSPRPSVSVVASRNRPTSVRTAAGLRLAIVVVSLSVATVQPPASSAAGLPSTVTSRRVHRPSAAIVSDGAASGPAARSICISARAAPSPTPLATQDSVLSHATSHDLYVS